MKAVRIHDTGSPEVLRMDDVDTPAPGKGHVLIRVAAAGVNYTDVMARQGVYMTRDAALDLPAVLGTEVAGVVVVAGDGVPSDLVGRRVIAFVHGGYAEYAVAPLELVTRLPDSVYVAEGVSYLVQGVTAWQLLEDCGRLEAGQSVLVHSAAGGVGTLAVQIAKARGASLVIATASSDEKRQLAQELGADITIDYTKPDWSERVLEATGGQGVDVVLDAVGGDVGEQSLGSLAAYGRLVVYGVSSGRLAAFAGSQLMLKNQSVVGYWLARRLVADGTRPSVASHVVPRLLELAVADQLHGVVRHAFALDRAAEAHRAVADRLTVGKIVLTT